MGMHKFKIFIFYTGVLSQENKQEHQYKQDDRNAIYSNQDDEPPPTESGSLLQAENSRMNDERASKQANPHLGEKW